MTFQNKLSLTHFETSTFCCPNHNIVTLKKHEKIACYSESRYETVNLHLLNI